MFRSTLYARLPFGRRSFATKYVKLIRQTPQSKKQPLITCKLDKFNRYQNENNKELNAKFGELPLASYGWKHYKSKGDYFTIHASDRESISDLNAAQFESFGLDAQLLRNIRNIGIMSASSVQSKAMPQIRAMDHTLIAAETGCGKTLAYLVPIIQQILERKQREQHARNMNTPLGIILTPGRELAEQIYGVAQRLCDNLNIGVNLIIGGKTKQQIMNPPFSDVDLLVGSLGATSKLVTTGIYRVNHVRHVVLDEADTLLDDSFHEKLSVFLKRFPFYRNHLDDFNSDTVGTQLVMAAATMPMNTNDLLNRIIDPETVHEVVSSKLHRILPHVKQTFLRMRKISRPIQLLKLVKADIERSHPVMIFGNKSSTSDYISMFLNDHGVDCANLNGDMLQKIRVGRFDSFQKGEIKVLSTTDIGSRGLDTTRVRHIINFDFPLHMADYIHRIGRIGRYGSSEHAEITNFISSLREIDLVQKIEHTARTGGVLPNVNANITNVIHRRIMNNLEREKQTG